MANGLGEFVRKRRIELGLTQERVAAAAGVGRAHLSQIESGKIELPNVDLRRRLAAALDVSHLDLLVVAGELDADEVGRAAAAPWSELDALAASMPSEARDALLTIARHLAQSHGR